MNKGESDGALPEPILSILRDADSALLKMTGESHHLLYKLIHETVARINHVDSFYIGFYYDGGLMVFPYSHDEKAYWDPNKKKYSPEGLGSWILRNRRPYFYALDDGELMHRGIKYGKTSKVSRDCVLVPVFKRPTGRAAVRADNPVIAVICMQSYREKTYDETSIRALEWLANDLSIILQREREDQARRRVLGGPAVVHEPYLLNPESIVNQMLEKMAGIKRKADALVSILTGDDRVQDESVLTMALDLQLECEQRQTETIELFLHSALNAGNPLALLTEAERRVARVLVEGFLRSTEGYTDVEIAESLSLSESTVKSHLGKMYNKLQVSGRSAAAQILRPYIAVGKPKR